MIAYAQSGVEVAEGFLIKLNNAIIFPLITLLMGVALLVFLFGCFEYIMGSNDETARTKGKAHIMWGIIGLLVMVSAYAILGIAAGTFGIDVNNL